MAVEARLLRRCRVLPVLFMAGLLVIGLSPFPLPAAGPWTSPNWRRPGRRPPVTSRQRKGYDKRSGAGGRVGGRVRPAGLRTWTMQAADTPRPEAPTMNLGETPSPVLKAYRWLCLAFGVIYPIYGLLHHAGGRKVADPMALRLLLAGVVLVFLLLSYVSRHVRERFYLYVALLGYAVGSHFVYLLYRNDFALEYAVGYILILVVIGHLYLRLSHLLVFLLFMVGATVVAGGLSSHPRNLPVLYAAAATFGMSSLVSLWLRLRITGELRESNRRLSEEVEARARTQVELERAREGAEAADQAKSRFLATMSHELRTPLNSVIGFTSVLARNRHGHLDEAELGYLERIGENGRRLLALIEEILALSRAEGALVPGRREPVALEQLVREVVDELAPGIEGRPVQLLTEVPPDLAPLRTDRAKLGRILRNLLDNALKFTERGHVCVQVIRAESDPVPRGIEIQDTGIGIPADHLDSIFHPFQQLDSGTARKYGGSGLGLAACRAYASLLGYSLEVESEPGRGSRFRLLFVPARQPEPAPLAAKES